MGSLSNPWVGTRHKSAARWLRADTTRRAELHGLGTKRQIARCVGLGERPTRPLEHRMTARGLRCTARRI